jgi:cytidine deaminase
MCAERSALYYASSAYPNTPIEAIAVVAYVNGKIADVPAYPCGSCRQAILQYELKFSKDIRVIVVGNGRVEVFDSIKSLLPFAFDTI